MLLLRTFLALIIQDAPGSSCIFSHPVLGSTDSQRNPSSINWRMVFRKQDMGTSCAHCQWAISDSRQTLSMDSDKKYCWPLNNVGVTPCITTVSQSSIASDPLRPHVQPAPDHVLLQSSNSWTVLWRRQWHPTPVLLPGKSHGWRSLVGCSPWGR